MKNKVSFVIIAYNEEKTISKGINSILSQNGLRDYEVIVVNDGSKDKTAEIVNNFSKKNKRVRLIDFKENKGRGFARAIGVNEAKGDYIAFIDADIILPTNWLNTCLTEIKDSDAVGGIAVPDGDVNYIWRKCKIKPKIVNHSTIVTGSNGFYTRKLLNSIKFNSNLKEGEDFDINNRLIEKGFKLKSLKNLIVEHRESRLYINSLKWIYINGKRATTLLNKYKKIRLPDLAFFGFIFLILLSVAELILFNSFYFLIISLVYPLLTSLLHINSKFKFEIKKSVNFLLAVILNYPLIFVYYLGRIKGVFKR
jgi:glycosyltransferase involved in cell wall biosynthesis